MRLSPSLPLLGLASSGVAFAQSSLTTLTTTTVSTTSVTSNGSTSSASSATSGASVTSKYSSVSSGTTPAAASSSSVASATTATTTITNSTSTAAAAASNAVTIDVGDLWNILVGPVTTANITTFVEPTPVPSTSLIPPPPLYYSPFPSGQQVPLQMKNESWSFPADFLWGVAGAAYQIEGAVDADGRGPSVWDVKSHRVTDYIYNNYTADVTDNNYYLYKQDIARIAAMGVKAYSLTISWTRILPLGRGQINQAGIDYCNDVINEVLQYNITPIVTLYHWDTPLVLDNSYGGWLSESIVDDFTAYAKIVYQAYGDRVKHWFTVNEPIVFCSYYPLPDGYFKNFTIPTKQQPFYCGQNVLLAHSAAYHLGKSMIPDAQISYKNNGGYKIPLTNSTDDAQAVQRAWDFNEGWFSEPVFLTGDYPASLKSYVSTFLRNFTTEESQRINGSADFYAHDAYTSEFYFAPDAGVAACAVEPSNALYPTCANSSYTYAAGDGGWAIGPYADPLSPWLHAATDWVPAFLQYLQTTWAKDKSVIVSEFGFAEPFEGQKTVLQDILYDPVRSAYYHGYTRGMLIALSEGVKLMGCVAWSFVDNYEWATGFGSKFGMQYVNFSDPTLPRYYKASFFEYKSAFDLYQETA